MDAIRRDEARRFQRERVKAVYQGSEQKAALRLGITRQTLSSRQAIRYDELGKLARDPKALPEAFINGARVVVEQARTEHLDLTECAQRMAYWLGREQAADSAEDPPQVPVIQVVAAIPFMSDSLTLRFRTDASAHLEKWENDALAAADATVAAVAYSRALRSRLQPVEGR